MAPKARYFWHRAKDCLIDRVAVALLFVLAAMSSHAAEVIPPKPAAYFNDYAGVVPKEAAHRFNEQLAQFERETSNQVVVAGSPKRGVLGKKESVTALCYSFSHKTGKCLFKSAMDWRAPFRT